MGPRKLLGEEDAQGVRERKEGTWGLCEKQASPPQRGSSLRTDQPRHPDDPVLKASGTAPSVGLPKTTQLNSATAQGSVEVTDIDKAMGGLCTSRAQI